MIDKKTLGKISRLLGDGLTQREVARRTGVSRGTVNNLAHGRLSKTSPPKPPEIISSEWCCGCNAKGLHINGACVACAARAARADPIINRVATVDAGVAPDLEPEDELRRQEVDRKIAAAKKRDTAREIERKREHSRKLRLADMGVQRVQMTGTDE